MSKISKRTKLVDSKIDREKLHTVNEAIDLLKSVKATKFDETVELALRLGVDPRKADQMIRGTCALPHGLGKEVRIVVFAKGEKILEAQEAGADHVGGEELSKKIQEGWFDFERVVATPDMMNVVGRIGKILGPRGLMPNPKVGTVTFDLAPLIKTIKSGQVEFRVDKQANLQAPMGKISFESDKLEGNIAAFIDAVKRLKPSSSKGVFLQSCSLSSTMGPGLKVDVSAAV